MDGNDTYLLQEYSREIIRVLLPIDILCSIILLTGVIGNIFVIFIYAIKMRKDQRESRYFIPILAFYDLMVCIISEIYFLSKTFFWATFYSDELCKTLLFFLLQTVMTSDAFLLVIAVQRYIMICRPLGKQMTLFWRRITIALVVAANIAYSIPMTIVSGVQETPLVYRNVNISGERCSLGNEKFPLFQLIYSGIVMIIVVANIVVTAAMYTPITCVIYRRLRNRHGLRRTGSTVSSSITSGSAETTFVTQTNSAGSRKTLSKTEDYRISSTSRNSIASSAITKVNDQVQSKTNENKRNRRSKTNFNMMFFVIITVYVVSYVTTAIRLTVLQYDDTVSSDHAIRFYTFLRRIYVFNHVANPFIYAYFDSGVRSYLTYLFCK